MTGAPVGVPESVFPAKTVNTHFTGPYIVDLHCHPTLKNYLLDYRMWKRHRPHKGENYIHMQVDIHHLQQGNVAGILAAHHLPERGMKEQTWLFRKIYPLLRTVAPVFVTRLEDGTPANFRQLTTMMDDFEAHVKKTNEKCGKELLQIAKSFPAFKSGIAAGKIMVAQTIEGSHALGRNLRDEVMLDHVDFLAARGICLITLSHFFANDLSFPVEGITPHDKEGLKFHWQYDPSYDDRPLTSQGKKVVRRMLEKGILVDLTHMTPCGRGDVLDINDEIAATGGRKRPVLFTHGGVRTVVEKYQASGYENYRFLSADKGEILRIQECGGVIGLVFMNFWLTGSDTYTHSDQADDFENGIRFIVESIEAIHQITKDYRHVALGSDFDGFADSPADLRGPGEYSKLIDAIKKIPGITPDEVDGITHGNALRVLENGWG